MFIIVWKKMVKNRWMTICLLFGSLLAVLAMCLVPMYTQGILERMLRKDFESFQIRNKYYPGTVTVDSQFFYSREDGKKTLAHYNKVLGMAEGDFLSQMSTPLLCTSKMVDSKSFNVTIREDNQIKDRSKTNSHLTALYGVEEEAVIVSGRLPNDTVDDGVIEVMVHEMSIKSKEWLLGKEYNLVLNTNENSTPIPVRIVGVYQFSNNALFWGRSNSDTNKRMIMNTKLFEKTFVTEQSGAYLGGINIIYSFDYTKIKMADIDRLVTVLKDNKTKLSQTQTYLSASMSSIFEKYKVRRADLTMVLWVLQVPLLLMIVFYIVMVAKQTVGYDKNEISVLKSRGCTSVQVMVIYLLQSMVLAAVAVAVGPFLAFFSSKLLGSANGFLEFIGRAPLPVVITGTIYIYALIVGLTFIIMMLIPVYGGINTSIVEHKIKKSRKGGIPIWQKLCLDVLLIVVSLYALNQYKTRQMVLMATGADKTDFPVDPMVFLASTMFIFGLGLLFVRVYPLLLKLIFFAFKRIMNKNLYFSFLTISRSTTKNNFIMLFLILTLATGVFDATCARTINSNEEDRIRYNNGADIRLTGAWEPYNSDGTHYMNIAPTIGLPPSNAEKPIYLYEPLIDPIKELDSVDTVSKVLTKKRANVYLGGKETRSTLMAIEPSTFMKVAWSRPHLNPYSTYSYLKALAQNPRAVLLTKNFMEDNDIKQGDEININYDDQNNIKGVVYGFVDYWPTFNPINTETKLGKNYLVVANLSYIQSISRLEPYELFISLSKNATTQQFYDEIESAKISVNNVTSANQLVTARKNDPMIQGINGMLTIGFILIMFVCFVGFLIYWILDIKSRTLQLGILQSMGMSRGSVIMILVYEQLFISLVSVIAGIGAGTVAARLFVPILEIATNASNQVPPYLIQTTATDYLRVIAIAFVMLCIAVVVLWRLIVKINITKALKLGED